MLMSSGHCGIHGCGLGLMGTEVVWPGVHVSGVQPARVQHEGIKASGMSVSVTWREEKKEKP